MRIVDKRRQVNRRTFLRNGSAVTFGAAFVATTAVAAADIYEETFPRWVRIPEGPLPVSRGTSIHMTDWPMNIT